MFPRNKKLPGGPSTAVPFVQPDLEAGRARIRAGIAAFHDERKSSRKGLKSAASKRLKAAVKEGADA